MGKPKLSLTTVMLRALGVNTDEVLESTITIEADKFREKVTVALKLDLRGKTKSMLVTRMKHYELVEKSSKVDGVPSESLPPSSPQSLKKGIKPPFISEGGAGDPA